MKIDRLIGILTILAQKEQVSAPELAQKFEVSRRTINRDIEDLCKAGIPLVTQQGHGGGISIMEGFKLDRTLLSSVEMQSILAGLKSLDSVSSNKRYQQLMEKLSAGNPEILSSNQHIMFNLSSWHKNKLTSKIELIQKAIDESSLISFRYFSPKGESSRVVEPCMLIFEWASWYVWGYCRKKEAFRMFKLNRMLELSACKETFIPRQGADMYPAPQKIFTERFMAKAVFEPEMKWRLIEEFGPESLEPYKDGRILLKAGFADKQSLFGWILSFGNQAELLEPLELRNELCQLTKGIHKKYKS